MKKEEGKPADMSVPVRALPGPVAVFGAGGFIGINLLNKLLEYRNDVIGLSQDHKNNWRFLANGLSPEFVQSVDLLQPNRVREFMEVFRPRTIFNLAAYGAYSQQNEYDKILQTNFLAAVDLIETAKSVGFDAYVYAGSSSEYGSNSAGPHEDAEMIPNSHYGVSKAAAYTSLKYYGIREGLPVAHLRLYSVFGPWEEPDRLMPVAVAAARHGRYPAFVHPDISRDFVYIDDVVRAFLLAAIKIDSIKGKALNIGTGTKTTIGDLSRSLKKIFGIEAEPDFGTMPNRRWDLTDWYADNTLARRMLDWQPVVALEEGLKKIAAWQEEVDFDHAFWNR